MSGSPILIEPQNLTGQVIMDKTEEEFLGNYSCVYLCRYRNELVAAKVIQKTAEPESMKRKVKREIAIWATMNHPNILPFYGFADGEEFAPFGALISPWCDKGDASRYMSEYGESMLLKDRINLWRGVIQGIIYLHGHDPVIVHGDLKPGNILIGNLGTPMICDFGLARIFLEEGHSDMTTSSEHTGTARYLAPELVASDASIYPTAASDVYALGCLGLEFIYLQKPYANRKSNIRGQLYIDIRKGSPPATEPPHRTWPSQRLWILISEMWDRNPLSRPSAFIAEHMLDCIPLTLPPVITRRLVHVVAMTLGTSGSEVSNEKWMERCDLLRSLCLVSKVFKIYALPFLYGKIRLRLRQGKVPLSMLITTLSQSKGRDHSFGYGSFTKTLLFVIPAGKDIPSLELPPQEVQNLLHMMPELRSVVMSGNDAPPYHRLISTPATTLEVQGRHALLALSKNFTFQVLLFVQEFSIVCKEVLVDNWTTPNNPAASQLLLPNLRSISMVYLNEGPNETAWRILDRINGWAMPRLTRVRIDTHEGEWSQTSDRFRNSIESFLRKHGHSIRDLTLLGRQYGLVHRAGDLLPLCSNLRFLKVSHSNWDWIVDVFPRHTALETLIVYVPRRVHRNDSVQHLQRIEKFKDGLSAMLPKLRSVEIGWAPLVRYANEPLEVSQATFQAEL